MITEHVVTIDEIKNYFIRGNHDDIEHFEVMIKALFKIIIGTDDKMGASEHFVKTMIEIVNTERINIKTLKLLSKAFEEPEVFQDYLKCF